MIEEKDQLKSVYLIDASIYIFQSHFSSNIECVDNSGNDLSALYGFTQFLIQFIRRIRPNYIGVAHDGSLFTGFRHQLCNLYKSNREPPDENLARQLKGCFEISSVLGLSAFISEIYEADDIIGTLGHNIRKESELTSLRILTKDKDLAQLLLTADDFLWDYSANRTRCREDIPKEFGVLPEHFPDYLGLIGDAVDCIKGVPGIGPVKAKVLLKEFDSLEKIYENLEKISELPIAGAKGLAAKLKNNKDLAFLSKRLATIVCSVENFEESFGSASLNALQIKQVKQVEFDSFLNKYDFKESERENLMRIISSIIAR